MEMSKVEVICKERPVIRQAAHSDTVDACEEMDDDHNNSIHNTSIDDPILNPSYPGMASPQSTSGPPPSRKTSPPP